MDIGDAEFTSSSNYTFKIFEVPIWSGGSTAIPTDRASQDNAVMASSLSVTLIWMMIAVVISAFLEKVHFYRLPESAVVILFGILGTLLIRFVKVDISSVCFYFYEIINRVLYSILLCSHYSYLLSLCSILVLI